MKKSGRSHLRFILLASVFILTFGFFLARIIYLQINAPEIQVSSGLTTRTLTVKAVRGEIYDRNGKKLVSNEYYYNVYLDGGTFPKTNQSANETLISLMGLLDKAPETPYFPVEKKNGKYVYKELDKEGSAYTAFMKMLDKYSLTRSTKCDEFMAFLDKRYGLTDDNGDLTVESKYYLPLMALRYETERADFSILNPYTVATEVEMKVLTAVEEAGLDGVGIEKNVKRIYNYPGYASHILGRTGKIPAEELEYYTEQGYSMNAVVGVDGVEKAFEKYLRGVDGTLVIVEDKNGSIVDEYYKKEPVPGKDVYLTIDIEMQKTAEDALAYNIQYIKTTADNTIAQKTQQYTDPQGNLYPWATIPQYIGEDVSSGAATLVNPKNGEVYAMASYPTFDLTSYLQNYNTLLNGDNQPLFNRALLGTYEPGSTFKISVAAAALEYGIINKDTVIFDSGIYKYYNDFRPECWIYSSYGYGHGNVNVISAIQHSCNYFFYDVGRQLTIDNMNSYCLQLGLGESTGIELPESKGILAGPAYSASINKEWVPGDTVQAAIGQSDNTFTPLQLSMYLSTVINGGSRYKAHLLHSVREFGTDKVIYEAEPEILNTVPLSEDNLQLLKIGMRNVMENGTAAPVFANYPIDIGGKTGTAQVGKTKSNNGIFMAFAPYDEPEIVASCIIEQAGGSNEVGITIRRMFNKYFNITE